LAGVLARPGFNLFPTAETVNPTQPVLKHTQSCVLAEPINNNKNL